MFKWLTARVSHWKSGFAHPLRALAVFILVLILPAIGVVRDVVLSPQNRELYLLKYFPDWPWYWYALLIMALLFIFLSEASYRASKAAELRMEGLYADRIEKLESKVRLAEIHASTQELLAERRGALKTPSKAPTKAKETPAPEVHPPNIVFADSELIKVKLVDYGIFADGWDEQYGYLIETNYVALVAHYTNELDPPRKVGIAKDVSAQLTFIFDDGVKPLRINRGAWMRIANLRVPFGPNDNERLIVAVVNARGKPELQAVERESEYESRLRPLRDNRCRVRIRLVVEASSELLDDREFDLAMMDEPEFHIAFGEKKLSKADTTATDT